jgi:ApaG protein
VFTYQITIENNSGQSAQLVSRHWIITNANGTTHEVVGDGVVGEQPHLVPGASHTYSSFCPLDTPWGTMEGSFHMIADSGEAFSITVGRFFLVTPESTK